MKAPLHIMQSNGGMIGANSAIKKPAYTVESGPAAGVIAAARVAKMIGHSDIISLDMGGTTAKAALIEGGEPVKTTEYEVGAGINLSSKLVKGAGYAVKQRASTYPRLAREVAALPTWIRAACYT